MRRLSPQLYPHGARFDLIDAFTNENQLSPRINMVWQATPDTTFHAALCRSRPAWSGSAGIAYTVNRATDHSTLLTMDLLSGSGLRASAATVPKRDDASRLRRRQYVGRATYESRFGDRD
jgi:hypothetical protein